MQAKDRAQQQLRQKVTSVNCTMCVVTRVTAGRTAEVQ